VSTDFQASGFDLDAVGVIHQAPAQDSWQAWIAASFEPAQQGDPAITGPDADPDGDGKSNLVEYACGLLPNIAESESVLAISGANGKIVLQFHRDTRRADVTFTLQESPDGLTWSTLAVSSSGSAITAAAGVDIHEDGSPRSQVTVTTPLTGARRLFRLKITKA
jgi:hypothetical protein